MFSARADLEVASAGLAPDADEPVTAETVEWADVILVMERCTCAGFRASSALPCATPGSPVSGSRIPSTSWTSAWSRY
jgi:hypothetical protein